MFVGLLVTTDAFAQSDDRKSPTSRVLGVSGAVLGGLSLYFGLEAQLASSHEAAPSESRQGLATAFTVVSVSALSLSVVSLTIAFLLELFDDNEKVAMNTLGDGGRFVRVWCPDLSCLPSRAPP